MVENLDYLRRQVVLARTEIKNLRQQLSALKYENQEQIKSVKSILIGLHCSNCGETDVTSADGLNEQASISQNSDLIYMQPIGIVETSFQNKRGVPRQPCILAKAKGTVVINSNVFNNPDHALSGLEDFSHMWIIFHFHVTESANVSAKVAPPRLCGERRGVLSTRSPHRPCPIGLSLVKIQSIEGNRINFLGVDMVNGTPVLDIKPYIPQYDYPLSFDVPICLTRPPTEGISDVVETASNLHLNNNDFASSSTSTDGVGIDSNCPLTCSTLETISPTDQHLVTPISPSPDSPSSADLLDGSFRSSPLERDFERGAPDGQERFTPPQSAHLANLTQDGIRVASWISNPPSQTYEVRFTEDALVRLTELIGDRTPAFKNNIESLLSEDPRSHYVRSRYPEHEYCCVLEDVSISCVFDSSVCTIIAVRNAEEMQQI